MKPKIHLKTMLTFSFPNLHKTHLFTRRPRFLYLLSPPYSCQYTTLPQDVNMGEGKLMASAYYSLHTAAGWKVENFKKRKKGRLHLRFSQLLVPQFMNPTLMLRWQCMQGGFCFSEGDLGKDGVSLSLQELSDGTCSSKPSLSRTRARSRITRPSL